MTAVAVERALLESSPVQYPCGCRLRRSSAETVAAASWTRAANAAGSPASPAFSRAESTVGSPVCSTRSLAAGRGDEGEQLRHQVSEAVEGDLLRPVAPGFGRAGMDLDEKRVSPHGHGSFAHGADQVGPADA